MMTMKKFMIIKTSSEEVMDCEHDNETVTKIRKSSGCACVAFYDVMIL